MAIKVDTTAYRASHWSEPKPGQTGYWGFEFGADQFWFTDSYANAVKQVKKIIRTEMNVQDGYVVVCP